MKQVSRLTADDLMEPAYGWASFALPSASCRKNFTVTTLGSEYPEILPDGTPVVNYTYEWPGGVAYELGHLTQVSNTASLTRFAGFDPLRQVTDSQQITQGQTYNVHRDYNLMGSMVSETYYSGRIVTTTYDQANRPAYVQRNRSGTITNLHRVTGRFFYLGALYSSGGVYYLVRGNGLRQTTGYNARLQPTEGYEADVQRSKTDVLCFVHESGMVRTEVHPRTLWLTGYKSLSGYGGLSEL